MLVNRHLAALVVAAVVGVTALVSLSSVARAEDLPKAELPEGVKGFVGEMVGEVVKVGENGFVLKVKEAKPAPQKNAAKEPNAAVGKELLVNVGWAKVGDKWAPVGPQAAWIKLLRAGDAIRVYVKNDEGDRLHIIELNNDQRKQVEQAEKDRKEAEKNGGGKGDPIQPGNNGGDKRDENKGDKEQGDFPEALQNFAGVFECKVAEIGEGKLVVELVALAQVWKANRAGNPRAAVGKRIVVWLRLVKDGNKQVPNGLMAAWLKGVKVGQNVKLDLKAGDGKVWLVELNDEQRQQAERNK